MISEGEKKVARYKKNGYKKNYRKNYKKTYKKKQKYSRLERLAYDVGRIVHGVNNPDSKVYESYSKGNTEPKKTVRKPLI